MLEGKADSVEKIIRGSFTHHEKYFDELDNTFNFGNAEEEMKKSSDKEEFGDKRIRSGSNRVQRTAGA